MTGPEHYKEAEALLTYASTYEGLPSNDHVQVGQLAQVHAMLALAAATALGVRDDQGFPCPGNYEEWRAAAAPKGAAS